MLRCYKKWLRLTFPIRNCPMPQKLLFITQKFHGQDAFGALWVEALQARGYAVEVVCLEWRPEEAARVLGRTLSFSVHSLGKEHGYGRIRQILRFLRLASRLRYDRIFIHMTPIWGLVGAPVWILRRIPVYLWYTHYKMQPGLLVLGWYAKRLFCATTQSLPQYEHSPKKIVVGHGIDLSFWKRRDNRCEDPWSLLVVHRLSRSKRLELVIRAMAHLPPEATLHVYGIAAEPEYVRELHALVQELSLVDRVTFHGTLAMKELPEVYVRHRLILNMASETIDKTMLEAMTCGCYPVTTARNAQAIGIPIAPGSDEPQAIADCARACLADASLSPEEMYGIVAKRHSLTALMERMDAFIRPGQ